MIAFNLIVLTAQPYLNSRVFVFCKCSLVALCKMATFMEQKDASLINKLAYRENESDMEHIVLKPSAELIPDEYQHTDNKAALVHIFRGEYKHDALNTKALIVSLNQLGYEVPYKNVHFIRRKEQVQKDLDNSKNELIKSVRS